MTIAQICKKYIMFFLLLMLLILPVAADERMDRNSYKTVQGEIYHVLAAVRWIDGEGGSYLFQRLDGYNDERTWYVDFLENDEAIGYEWPENCFTGGLGFVRGTEENTIGNNWLRDHDAIMAFRESYPFSGYDLSVRDDLSAVSLEDAGPLVADLAYLFEAPMMKSKDLNWTFRSEYDPENQALSLSVGLNTPYGMVSKWEMEYRRHAATGKVEKLDLRVSSFEPSVYTEAPPEAYEILEKAAARKEFFEAVFLQRLYNYLNIFYTGKWPAYTLLYPDARVRFSTGESGGGSFYRFTLF